MLVLGLNLLLSRVGCFKSFWVSLDLLLGRFDIFWVFLSRFWSFWISLDVFLGRFGLFCFSVVLARFVSMSSLVEAN